MTNLNIGDLFYFPETDDGHLFAIGLAVQQGAPIGGGKENTKLIFLFDEQDLKDENGNRRSPKQARSLVFHPPAVAKELMVKIHQQSVQQKQDIFLSDVKPSFIASDGKKYKVAHAHMTYPMDFAHYYQPITDIEHFHALLETVQKLCEQDAMMPHEVVKTINVLKYAERFFSSSLHSISSPKLSL